MAKGRKPPATDAINFAKIAADLDTNPKIRRAGRNGREVFSFVLRRVAMHRAQGRIPVSNVDAFYLGEQLMMSEAEAEQGLTACLKTYPKPGGGETKPLLQIAGGEVIVVGWNDEWGRYPMTEAERKRKERAEKATGTDDAPECPDVSGQNVTRPDCHGSDQIRSEINPESLSLGLETSSWSEPDPRARDRAQIEEPPPPAEPPPGLALELADRWTPAPEPELDAEAQALGVDLADELVKLRDRARQFGKTSADWQASWREWVRRAIDWKRKQPAPTRAAVELAQRFGQSGPRVQRVQRAIARGEDPELARIAENARLAERDRDSVAQMAAAALRNGFAQHAARDRERPPPNDNAQRAEDLPVIRRTASAALESNASDHEGATE